MKHGLRYKPAYYLWSKAKQRAKNKNLDFNLNVEDINIPDVCPILGIPIFTGKKVVTKNSPTIDKINPRKGYTKDNICIISMRANKLKADFTIEQIERLVTYMENLNG